MNTTMHMENTNPPAVDGTQRVNDGQTTLVNNTVTTVQSEEVTVYKAENKLLIWLLIILGLLMLLAIAALIVCCICPGCPFYMAPRKRRVYSSETLVVRSDGRPKRHLHRQPAVAAEVSWNGRKQAWSADPTRRNWQFNKKNVVKNCSLPGDVAYVASGQPGDLQMTLEAQRLRDGGSRYEAHSRRSRMNEQERMYMEDVEEQKRAARGYRTAELDSLQRHEADRGSDLQHQAYRQRFMEADVNVEEQPTVREQHFYREGNAEVLRLVTRGQLEDTSHVHQRPTALIVDGKDIILQRFIEDQRSRHELSMQDIEAARSMESHQRSKEVCQQQQQPPEIILIPERLDLGHHRQHLSSLEEIRPTVQRLVIDHGDYADSQKTAEREPLQMRETLRQEKQEHADVRAVTSVPISDKPPPTIPDIPIKEQRAVQPADDATRYSFHDFELARQNALLTRLLLERESRRAAGGGMDSTSYLETQSLPGQVAIATQTDRTAATQTERQVKSRSDNDESDEESKHRRKLKSRKKYGDGDWRRSARAPWTKSPIEEEARRSPCFDKRLSILRKKVREVKEGRKISLEPGVLREISDSLDGNGSCSCKGEEDETTRRSYQRTEQTSISYKILNEKESGSQSSEEKRPASSPEEAKLQRERREKSPARKSEARSKTQKRPSFRILEKEFTMLTKKLSKLGERKFQESTGSTDEKSDAFAKKTDSSTSSQKQTAERASASKAEQKGKQRKDSAIAKTKQKLKYQQSQVMSTGSSELDDGLDKPKKSSVKQRQPIGGQSHAKVKRQAQIDRRESKRQSMPDYRDQGVEKRREAASKDTPKLEPKSDKLGKTTTRAPKLAALSRKRNASEETSTSTAEEKKDEAATFFPARDFATKKSNTHLSEGDSNASNRRADSTKRRREAETLPKEIIRQKFSDDFVEEPKTDEEGKRAAAEAGRKSDTTVQVSENELNKGMQENSFEKDASTEKQLITGSTVARDRRADKTSSGTESTESVKYAEKEETERDVARHVQRDYKEKDESLEERIETKTTDAWSKEKEKQGEQKMRKLSKDFGKESVASEGIDETEAAYKAQRQTRAGEKDAYILLDYADGAKGITLDVEDKAEDREAEMDETDGEEEKQITHAKDVSTLDYATTGQKGIEFNVRDEKKIDLNAIKVPYEYEKETYDEKVEGDVLSDERGKYEDVEKMKSTFADRDKSIGDEKEEVAVRDAAEMKAVEITGDHKITEDREFEDKETLEEIATESSRDRQVTEQSNTSEDEKTDGNVAEETTTVEKSSKETRELSAERKIIETAKKGQSVEEEAKGYQTVEKVSEDDVPDDFEGIFDEEKEISTAVERETVRSDDREIPFDGKESDEESHQKERSSSPDAKEISTKREEQVVTADHEVSKEKEMVILERELASTDKEEASVADDKEEKLTTEGEKTSDLIKKRKLQEKEANKGTRETDEGRVGGEKIADIGQQLVTEETDDTSTIRKDTKEKDDTLKVSTTEKQDGEEAKEIDDHSVFSAVFKAVHSLVDTLTNGKTPSPEREAAATEQSLRDKKLIEEELSPLPSTSRINGDSVTLLGNEKAEEDTKVTTSSTEDTKEEKSEEPGEMDGLVELASSGNSADEQREINESSKDDEMKGTRVEELREEKPAEDNETVDDKLARTSEEGEQLLRIRPQTEEEKFASCAIISEVATDSGGTSESGKQLKSQSEQTELQEVEQLVGGETFAAMEGETTFPGKWSTMMVSDVPGIADWDNKHDLIVLRMDETSLAKEATEEGRPVSLERQLTDTTLTTRPYQTPRHRARRLSEKESSRVDEPTEAKRSIEDEGKEEVSIGETKDEDPFRIIEDTSEKGTERESPTKAMEVESECDSAVDKGSSTGAKDAKDSRAKAGIKADRQDGETETFKVVDRRVKELGRKRVSSQRKKKSSSEESSEEKAASIHAGHRTLRRKLPEDQSRQKDQSIDQTRQSTKRDERKQSLSKVKAQREKKSSSSSEKYPTPPKTGEIDTSKAQPKYMAWYKKNREEMERKRAELLATDDEDQLPRWLRRSMRNQKSEMEDGKREKKSSQKTADTTPMRTRRKVKPLVNVESEQLKAIVRQGRKLRRAEGGKNEDPPVQIFATTPPAVPQDPKHHLFQHSEYKYEKMPAPFYLHPPPAPHPSPQLSPEHYEIVVPPTVERTSEDFDSGVAVSLQQGGNRLRHQQLLEKKSVFDIAYSEAAPSQLRSDSTSPPS
ncbi:unnamed protein product, partial [Heterotrigona itama]